MREGRPDPTLFRNEWNRKPQTQVVPNRKAEQRRSCCRNRSEDGAVSFAAVICPVGAGTNRQTWARQDDIRRAPLLSR